MVAAVTAPRGEGPEGVVRRLGRPRPGSQVRSLAEEAARVVRTRGAQPEVARRPCSNHGYKGAFEVAATVDYLFGYDATADVVEDWMYERVTDAYVGDPDDAEVLRAVEPVGAARRSRERLLGGGRAGAVVGAVGGAPWRRCATGCWPPRAWRSGGRSGRLPVRRRRRQRRRQAGAAARHRRPRASAAVLLRGDKGSAKTTLARGLAAPRASGRSSSCRAGRHRGAAGRVARPRRGVLTGGPVQAQPASARRRRTAACSTSTRSTCSPTTSSTCCSTSPCRGVNRDRARRGISHAPPALGFVLVGSDEPEEGDLPALPARPASGWPSTCGPRPSLAERSAAVGRRLAFDADPAAFEWDEVRAVRSGCRRRRQRQWTDGRAAGGVDARQSRRRCNRLRADLVLGLAGGVPRASPGWEGRCRVTDDDLQRVAHGGSPTEQGATPSTRRRRTHPQPNLPRLIVQRGCAQSRTVIRHRPPSAVAAVVPLVAPRVEHPTAVSGRRSPVVGAAGRAIGAVVPDWPRRGRGPGRHRHRRRHPVGGRWLTESNRPTSARRGRRQPRRAGRRRRGRWAPTPAWPQ